MAKVTGSLNCPTFCGTSSNNKNPLNQRTAKVQTWPSGCQTYMRDNHAWGNVKVRAPRENNHAPLVLPLDELDVSSRDEMLPRFLSIVIIVFVSSFLSLCHALMGAGCDCCALALSNFSWCCLMQSRMRVTDQARSRCQCCFHTSSQLFKWAI